MPTCPAPISPGPGTTWNDCSVGVDPTRNGGDLLWVRIDYLTYQTQSAWGCAYGSNSKLTTGPTGDIAVTGFCLDPSSHEGKTFRFNGAGALTGFLDSVGYGWGGNGYAFARFGRHQDLALFAHSDHVNSTWDTLDRSYANGWYSYTGHSLLDWDSDALGNDFVNLYADTPLSLGAIQVPAAGWYMIRTGPGGNSFMPSYASNPVTADLAGGAYLNTTCGAGPLVGGIGRVDSAFSCVYSHPLPVAFSILASTNGAVILGASSTNPLDLGCGTLPAAAGGSTFVTALDGAGACIFGKSFPIPNLSLALDPVGRLLVSGFVASAPIDLGGGVLAPLGSTDFVTAELDAAGNHLWSRRFGAPGVSFWSAKVSTSDVGNVYLVTVFPGVIDLGGIAVDGSKGTILASFTPSGQARFARALAISGATFASVDGCGSLVIAGGGPSFNPGCGEVFPPPPSGKNFAIARFAP